MTDSVLTLRAFISLAIVVGLLAMFIWALRRGTLRLSGINGRTAMVIETAMSLGDRRSLAIVRVDGRRLLIGLTPSQVSMIADLPPTAPAPPGTVTEGK